MQFGSSSAYPLLKRFDKPVCNRVTVIKEEQ